jgi:hypothetical protein
MLEMTLEIMKSKALTTELAINRGTENSVLINVEAHILNANNPLNDWLHLLCHVLLSKCTGLFRASSSTCGQVDCVCGAKLPMHLPHQIEGCICSANRSSKKKERKTMSKEATHIWHYSYILRPFLS